MKTCIDCNVDKEAFDFYKHPSAADGRMGRCKECTKLRRKERYEKLKIDSVACDPNILKTCSSCNMSKPNCEFYPQIGGKFGTYSTCAECQKLKKRQKRAEMPNYYIRYGKEMYRKHRPKNLSRRRRYYIKNKDQILSKHNEYCKKRAAVDPAFKLRRNISRRILLALNGRIKSGKTIKLLGCSPEYAKKHIESQFQDGMTWENYGVDGWHIDHIKPCCAFDLTNPEEQKRCFHYTNLQPLWAFDNMSKGGRWEND